MPAQPSNAVLILSAGADGSFIHHLALFDGPQEGIRVLNDDNVFQRLVVGLDLAGTDQGNTGSGFSIQGSGNTIRDSVNTANDGYGIELLDDTRLSPTQETTIAGNPIGTGLLGTGDFGNTLDGISLAGTGGDVADATIGGPTDPTPGGICDGDCNLISGNGSDGIEVRAPTDAIGGVVIRGNYIGTDVVGTAAIANGAMGVKLGGPVTGAEIRSNLLSGNTQHGIGASGSGGGANTEGPSGTTIAANLIGVDREGDAPLPNGSAGIRFESTLSDRDPISNNTIGGTADPTPGGACDGDCNLVSGNAVAGIVLLGEVDGTQVLGNYVGTDPTGTAAVANGQEGWCSRRRPQPRSARPRLRT